MDNFFRQIRSHVEQSRVAKELGPAPFLGAAVILLLIGFVSVSPPREVTSNLVVGAKTSTAPSTNKLAIVIDDVGYVEGAVETMLRMSRAITFAVLPQTPLGVDLAKKARSHGNQVIIHLPLEPEDREKSEPDTLFVDMSVDHMITTLEAAFARLPFAVGLNNHTGSRFSGDESALQTLFVALSKTRKPSQTLILDSKTIGDSKVAKIASEFGYSVRTRDVFLDNERDVDTIERQLEQAVQTARRAGSAIAIGHPYPETAQALQHFLSTLPEDIELVSLSKLYAF